MGKWGLRYVDVGGGYGVWGIDVVIQVVYMDVIDKEFYFYLIKKNHDATS